MAVKFYEQMLWYLVMGCEFFSFSFFLFFWGGRVYFVMWDVKFFLRQSKFLK